MKAIAWRGMSILALVLMFSATVCAQTEPAPTTKSNDPLAGMRFRNLGPAVGGGRVTAVTGIPGQPNTFYVGAAAGGVFKTTDGGITFKPIFEKEAVASVGAVAIAPSNPNLIWVGTGEYNPRNDVVTGRGVYFSPDAGASWKFMGLGETAQIADIVVHPTNPDVVYVAALGHIWGPNAERGVYRTTDGGKTWQKVLYVSDKTGAISLVMDPGNPMVLFAGMYEMQRFPWMLISGGESSGIYRSKDAGSTWSKLSEGLPKGPLGRIGIAAAPSNPNHIYALIEAKRGALWESNDLGDHWRQASENKTIITRGFYFTKLAVSPENENRVYFISYDVLESTDGGKTTRVASRGNHVDNHSLWIDPTNPERLISGNDGGVYISSDGAKSWRYLDNLPIEQFYMVAHDDEQPYMLCGGLQDNNGWCGASNTTGFSRGISGADWFTVVGGDGEYVVPAGHNSHIIYADSQNGSIQRLDLTTGFSQQVRPYMHGVGDFAPADLKYRFNWTSPIAVSAKDPNEVFLGGNVLFRSSDGGKHWAPISGDLTRNDKNKQQPSGGPVQLDLSGAETFDAILSISVSPIDDKVIWVGTDDGLVQMTRDGGKTWSNVSANISKLPEWGRVQQIEASPFDVNSAYVAFDFHEVDNNKPYAFRTHDGGKSWTTINKGLPDADPARVVRENPNRRGMLVLGTDAGLFYSYNDGDTWTALKSNFPTVPIYDVKFHKANHDLLIATHGRGLFVLDDIRPLEELSGDVAAHDLHLFSSGTQYRWTGGIRRGGDSTGYRAPGAMRGAVISYYLASEIETPQRNQGAGGAAGGAAGSDQEPTSQPATAGAGQGGGRGGRQSGGAAGAGFGPAANVPGRGPVKIVITDASGQTVKTIYGPGNKGVNRVSWDLTYEGAVRLASANRPEGEQEENPFFNRNAGPAALPGTYNVTVSVNGKTEKGTVQIAADPRIPFDAESAKTQFRAGMEMRALVSALNTALNRAESLHSQITSMQRILTADAGEEAGVRETAYTPVLMQARALDRKLRAWQGSVYNLEAGADANSRLHYLAKFNNRLEGAYRAVIGPYYQAPNEMVQEEVATVRKQLTESLGQFNALLQEVTNFNKTATEKGASTLYAGAPIELKADASSPGGSDDDEE
jgi:photosystem II stability/assembly factor-like uncharacterized protein